MEICIRTVIDAIQVSSITLDKTVDGLECGNPDEDVKGVVVTFLASQEVLEKAITLAANLIISHEGIFYSHWDKREMLQSDPVYLEKSRILRESGMAIYRYHDAIHRCIPDGIMAGLLQSLDWRRYEIEALEAASILEIPGMTLNKTIQYVKERLGIKRVRFAGDLTAPCGRIGLLVGYRGMGELAIPLFRKEDLDLVIYGEGPEWETPEYIQDAVFQGRKKAMIVLGHAESESPGMECFARRLQGMFPSVPVHFIEHEPVLRII